MKKVKYFTLIFVVLTMTSYVSKNRESNHHEMAGVLLHDTLEAIPDKLVVLTFDDAVASHYTFVRPILKKYGFSATFFITEGFNFNTDKKNYLSWDQIEKLNQEGFEIGNHTKDHESITEDNVSKLKKQIEFINDRCKEHGIPKPVSFAYPGNIILAEALPILKEEGIIWARRGNIPEYSGGTEGRGFAYEPGIDDPLMIPSAGIALPAWTFEDLKISADKAHDGRIAVLQFHGVPDREHPWVNTNPKLFRSFMKYLHEEGFHVIALRDLKRYVDPSIHPKDPWEIVHQRKKILDTVKN